MVTQPPSQRVWMGNSRNHHQTKPSFLNPRDLALTACNHTLKLNCMLVRAPDAHNAWEYVVHAAYWTYRALGHVAADPPTRFDEPGSDFFERPAVGRTLAADLDRLRERGSRVRAFFLLPKIVFVVAAIAVSIVALGSVLELSLRTGVVVGLVLLLSQALLEDASL